MHDTGGRPASGYNTAVGHNSMGGQWGTGADVGYNTAVGRGTMAAALDGASNNVAVGNNSLGALTSGDDNTVIGSTAGDALTTGAGNVLIGMNAGGNFDAEDHNIAIGRSAFGGASSAGYCVVIGGTAVQGAATQNGTVAVGYNALNALTTGAGNVAVGYQAADAVTTGEHNTVLGYQAMTAANGDEDENTIIGYIAGDAIDDGNSNTIVGSQAGTNDVNLTTGDYNTLLGAAADVSTADAQNQTAIGFDCSAVADNSVTLGNASVTDVYMSQDSQAYVHSQNVPNHVANTMSAPYYRFDGTDDTITADNVINDFPFSVSCNFRTGISFTGAHAIFSINDENVAENYFTLYVDSDGDLISLRRTSATESSIDTGFDLSTNTNYHIVGVWDSATTATVYVNGVSVYAATGLASVLMSSAFDKLLFGYLRVSSAAYFWNGEISNLKVFNYSVSATEVKELYSGASVPYKYKGANETELIVNGDFGSGTGWTFTSGWSHDTGNDEADYNGSTSYTDVKRTLGTAIVIGEAYRITFDVTNSNITLATTIGDYNTHWLDTWTSYTTYAVGSHSVEGVAKLAGTDWRMYAHTTAGSGSITNISVKRIGAVAEYDGSGITNDKWYDKSGNELHGTVSGATDENTAGAPVISANHPAFNAYPSSNQNDFALDSDVTVVFGSERFDQGSNFASNTFTAPVTGKYQLQVSLRVYNADSAAAYYQVKIQTSNTNYDAISDLDFGQDAVYWNHSLTILADMDVNDTAIVSIRQSSGTQQTDVQTESWFSGFLVC